MHTDSDRDVPEAELVSRQLAAKQQTGVMDAVITASSVESD